MSTSFFQLGMSYFTEPCTYLAETQLISLWIPECRFIPLEKGKPTVQKTTNPRKRFEEKEGSIKISHRLHAPN